MKVISVFFILLDIVQDYFGSDNFDVIEDRFGISVIKEVTQKIDSDWDLVNKDRMDVVNAPDTGTVDL